jgi:2-oxoisovalerate dehydrogenase E1 component alpha subunit
VALAFRLRRERRAAVCIFGDGAISKGDVAEAPNVAGVWKLAVVFVVSNNGWAISTPRHQQSAAETLAQKAIAAGFAGEQVDGNDVIAVHGAISGALERARSGAGPHLIEALTYRLGDHTTADDASRYSDDSEASRHWPEEAIPRLRRFLIEAGHWTKADEERLLQESAAEITAAAEAYLGMPPQDPATMFDYTFASLPAELVLQRQAALGGSGVAASKIKISNRPD